MDGLQKVETGRPVGYPVPSAKQKDKGQSVPQIPKEAGDRNDVVVDWGKTVQATLDSLKNQYQNVQVVIGDFSGMDDLKQYAQNMGSGSYLVISQGFLDQMASGREAFQNGKDLLHQIFGHLSLGKGSGLGFGAYVSEQEVTYWYSAEEQKPTLPDVNSPQNKTLIDWMNEAKEKAEKLRKSFQVKNVSSFYHQPTQIYSRLARAKTIGSVKSVMSNAQNKIFQLKRAISAADGADKEKLRAVLSQLQGSVNQARRKARSLEAESRLQRQQKKAEREQKFRKATRISYEVRRRRSARVSSEYAQVNRSSMWALYMAHRDYKEQMQQLRNQSLGISPAPDVSVSPAAAVAPAPAAAPASVVMSTPVSIPIA